MRYIAPLTEDANVHDAGVQVASAAAEVLAGVELRLGSLRQDVCPQGVPCAARTSKGRPIGRPSDAAGKGKLSLLPQPQDPSAMITQIVRRQPASEVTNAV